jgi:hypothetical protein
LKKVQHQISLIQLHKNFIRNQKRQILCKKIDLLEKMISQIFQPPDILAFIADVAGFELIISGLKRQDLF